MARELFEAREAEGDLLERQARPPLAVPENAPPGLQPGPAWVLALQRQAGNRAVASLLSQGGARGPTLQRKVDGGQQAEIQARADGVAAEAKEAAEDRDEEDEPPAIDQA